MTALTLDQLLETEALLYRAARTGLDDFLKRDLAEAVDCAGGGEGDRHSRCHDLLRPMALRDDHCRAAQGVLCRALRDKLHTIPGISGHFHAFGISRISTDTDANVAEALERRMRLMMATVNAYLHDEPGVAWQLVAPCTTADRLIVLGCTATMLHKAMIGRVLLNPPRLAQQDDGDHGGGGQ